MGYFTQTEEYINSINYETSDPLDQKVSDLVSDEAKYERASQALRRRFVRGAETVEGIDRDNRWTRIKREKDGGTYRYFVEGGDGTWSEPEERVWIVGMYALWQDKK